MADRHSATLSIWEIEAPKAALLAYIEVLEGLVRAIGPAGFLVGTDLLKFGEADCQVEPDQAWVWMELTGG